MNNHSEASLWTTEYALRVARQIASLPGVYCGPASIVWIAAVWNAHVGRPYHPLARLQDKLLFGDGPRTFAHELPGFREDLSQTLYRETQGQLKLSSEIIFRYRHIHQALGRERMPFIVRIPTASLRDGLHYVTVYKSVFTGDSFLFSWQDNGVFRSGEKLQEGMHRATRPSNRASFFFWGARQVVRVNP